MMQHIAPALGLLTHVVERDLADRRGEELVLGRLSFDILGPVPVDVVETSVRVLRSGRRIELAEAALSHDRQDAVILRAWLMRRRDTSDLQASVLSSITPRSEMLSWDPSSVWPGGFIASVEVRREEIEPGRASFWVRTPVSLLRDEQVSEIAKTAALLDIANGMTVRVSPKEVAFPNVDLTAHIFTAPHGDWIGFDTTVSFGREGVGVTSSVLHDASGPIGTMSQILAVRADT